MYQVEAVHSEEVRFYMPCHILAVFVCTIGEKVRYLDFVIFIDMQNYNSLVFRFTGGCSKVIKTSLDLWYV